MSLFKYEIFNKTAEIGSFTKAGEQLGLTQSAVSHAISSLEKEFGFELIHRSKNGLKLTTDGQIMLNAIRQVLQAQELLKQEAANINGVTKGTVRIGTFSSISTKWLPIIIQKMEQEYPGIQIKLFEGDYYEIEQMLLDGVIDCGFLNHPYSNLFSYTPLFRDRLLCIVSKKSPLFKKDMVDIKDIELEPFIMTSYNGTNDVKTILDMYNIKTNIRFELFDENGIVSMVEHGLGISILPELVLNKLPMDVRAIPLQQNCYRTIGIATKQSHSPATAKFIEVLTSFSKTLHT
ncbi:MAG TPA: LysR family transcriptional regulator [Ureibacillus sp.]|nr:LysR family transcriptional regulator [Ureibacillus sp.]